MRVLCKVIAGSHLFGTNRPESDTDYKGVYLPSADDILMGTYKHTINQSTGEEHSKNTSKDVDMEMWSLKKFFDLIYVANNHALEILFAPDEMIVESSPEWEYIRSQKHLLVCKKVQNYIEYCQSQAAKYGVKGSRVASVKAAIQIIKRFAPPRLHGTYGAKLEEIWDDLKYHLKDIEHINFFEAGTLSKQTVDVIEVNNRKFQKTAGINYCLDALKKIYDNYGDRAKQAEENKGIDWKAISHAYRVGKQAHELLNTGSITLPMKEPERAYTLALKQNEKNLTIPFEEVRPILESLADNLKEAVSNSKLPEKVNEDKWNAYVVRIYATEILREYQNK